MRVAVVPGPGPAGLICRIGDDGRPGAPVPAADLASAIRGHERSAVVRWVWPSTADLYPRLLRAGVRVGRCHDAGLVEALLLGRAGRPGEPAGLAAAAARLHGAPVPAASVPVPAGPQQALFDPGDIGATGAAAAARAAMADLIAVQGAQQVQIADDPHPARFSLLAAAESAGGLAAEEMSAAGLPWDADVHNEMLTELLGHRPGPAPGPPLRPARLAELAAQIAAAFGGGRPVNPDSPAQLIRALAADGVRVQSTRQAVLKGVQHPAVPLLLEYKELARLHAAYGWAWLDTWVGGGRFRPEYVVGGVVSGRWASRGGGALQIPKLLRRAVIADPGWLFVVADAAQLEPRVLAALAGDSAFARAAAGGDVYAALASAFSGDRAKAKVALLSAMYGGAGGEAGQLLAVLRQRFPQASGYVEAAARAGEEGRVVRSVLGRTCPPPSAAWRSVTGESGDPEVERDPGAGRAARARGRFTRNFVVQASAADWALVALAGLRQRLAAIGSPPARPQLVFFQHDEMIVHCPAGLADAVAAAVAEAAAAAGRLVFGATPVSFPMTTALVRCYADAK